MLRVEMNKDAFDKYTLRINYEQAKKLQSLIESNIDFNKLSVGDVLDLNMITVQLEDIINLEENNV